MNATLRKLLKKGKPSAIPGNIEPMLATLVDKIPGDEQNWIYEIKWDGYRAVALMNKGKIEEIGEAEQVYFHPQKEYTRQLIASIPKGISSL